MKRCSLPVVIIVFFAVVVTATITSCSNGIIYDQTKSHHGKNSFKSSVDATFFQWLSMRFREGALPTIDSNDIENILQNGADKVAINTAAVNNPSLIYKATRIFGSSTIVISIQAY